MFLFEKVAHFLFVAVKESGGSSSFDSLVGGMLVNSHIPTLEVWSGSVRGFVPSCVFYHTVVRRPGVRPCLPSR